MKKVYFSTLGCRTNQYETQAMRENFLKAGYEITRRAKEADLFVLNTCTVTAQADRKSRSLIRRFNQENPAAAIAVTGCYATNNGEEIAALPGVRFVVPNQEKNRIVEIVQADAVGKFCGTGDQSENNPFKNFEISYFADRTRAFIKVQDGCNHTCTYCKVVLVRGISVSRPIPDILKEANALGERGYQEVVLTGIQLGDYGDDFKNNTDLVSLLEELVKIESILRIRMSSIDPSDITDRVIDFMARHPKVCPQLHLPLQSGDDEILKRMKRPYRRGHFLSTIRKLKEKVPDFAYSTDVMVGFPGEEENHFANTLEVLRDTLPLKVHVFPYSAREGTRAVDFPDAVDKVKKQEMVIKLQELGAELAAQYQQPFLGQVREVMAEGLGEGGIWEGFTTNYMRVTFSAPGNLRGELIPTRLLALSQDGFSGEALL